jgi:long-subunit fatty acid transport protein
VRQLSRSVWTRWLLAIGVIAVAAPITAFAVTDEEIFRDFRFNLINPGARSLGLGGAFIAVADDATASLANPAGLMLLERPEFFTEVRDINGADSSLEQNLGGGDTIESETFPNSVFSPSFMSYVYPFERFAVGISRVEVNKANNTTSSFLLLDFDSDPNTPSDFIGGDGVITSELSVWNISGAIQIVDSLSFGATVTIGLLDLESSVVNTIAEPSDPNMPEARVLYETAIDDNDTDIAFNAGIHWKPLDTLSFGAVYRGGMKFLVEETVFNDAFFGTTPPTFGQFLGSPLDTTFNTPDSYGAGVAWQPLPALTLSADWVHIEYEDLLDGFMSGLNILTFTDFRDQFTIEDADEIHFGAEYVFTTGSIPIAARVGAYTDHNSQLFADFENPPSTDSETHITVGTGVVVQGKFQIDAAADFSEIGDTYVLSTIFRF